MLAATFAALRHRNEAALVLFVTAGDPGLDELPHILDALEDAGADILEVGLPFSDPIADGPTIQASSQRALDRGVTPPRVLEAIATRQGRAPIVLMGYMNTALRMGLSTFAQAAKAAGCAATILSDLTPEEAEKWCTVSRGAALDTVFLAAPTSTEERLRHVASRSTGFVYAVSRTGVTGAEAGVGPAAASLVERVRAHTKLPVCVGFGVSSTADVATLASVANGVIIGSHLVARLAAGWPSDREAILEEVRAFKAATRR